MLLFRLKLWSLDPKKKNFNKSPPNSQVHHKINPNLILKRLICLTEKSGDLLSLGGKMSEKTIFYIT